MSSSTEAVCLVAQQGCRFISHPDTNGFLLRCPVHGGDFDRDDWVAAQPLPVRCAKHAEPDEDCEDGCRLVRYMNKTYIHSKAQRA